MKTIGIVLIAFLATGAASAQRMRPRVYIEQTTSSSGGLTTGALWPLWIHGSGLRPQTAEIMKTFGDRCPSVTITTDRSKASYVILLEHEGGKDLLAHDNKLAVLNAAQDMIYSHSTVELGSAVKDACTAILQDIAAPSKIANATAGVFGYRTDQGFAITALAPDTPAARAGVRPGDVITAVDGRDIFDDREMDAAITLNRSGSVSIAYMLNGDWQILHQVTVSK